jgi:hypothetical protein
MMEIPQFISAAYALGLCTKRTRIMLSLFLKVGRGVVRNVICHLSFPLDWDLGRNVLDSNCFSCERLVDEDEIIEIERTPLHDAVMLCQSCYDDGITSRDMYLALFHTSDKAKK